MEDFRPLSAVQIVKDNYENFITSAFPIKDGVLTREFQTLIEQENLLWNGPFISIARQYAHSSKPASNLFQEIGISSEIARILSVSSLYLHQEQAIRSIVQGHNTVVATGTGSGKTEAFVIPILDYCLRHREERGIKAILIYPMNALANDQVDRMRHLLYFLNRNTTGRITVGRYVGDTPEDVGDMKGKIPLQRCPLWGIVEEFTCTRECENRMLLEAKDQTRLVCTKNPDLVVDSEFLTRKAMRENPPDILITNYVQLEYLLLRKKDSEIFNGQALRFLVFDEIHTYSGARGVEVALLVRRLRERFLSLGVTGLQLVGTSATISTHQDEKERRNSVARFGSQFFGAEVSSERVILETAKSSARPPKTYLPDQPIIFGEQPKDLAGSQDEFHGICKAIAPSVILQQMDYSGDRATILGQLLAGNSIFQALLESLSKKPERPESLIAELMEDPEIDKLLTPLSLNRRHIYLWQHLLLASLAADPELSSPRQFVPLIRPQVNIFYKTLGEAFPNGEIYACTNCRKLYASPRERCDNCRSVVEELGVCRFCGEAFYRATFDRNVCDKSRGALETLGKDTGLSAKRVSAKFDRVPYHSEFAPIWQTFEQPDKSHKGKQMMKCLSCGNLTSGSHTACDAGLPNLRQVYVYDRISLCPFCDRTYGGQQEAVTPFYMSPNTTSRLVFDVTYGALPKQLSKTLIFSDSRQDASYVAATIEDEHLNHAIRQMMYQVLRDEFQGTAEAGQIEARIIEILEQWAGHGLEDKDRQYYTIKVFEELASRAKQRSVESLGLIEFTYRGVHDLQAFIASATQYSPLVAFLQSKKTDFDFFRRYLHAILYIIRRERALSGLEKWDAGAMNIPTGYYLDEAKPEKGPSYEIKSALSGSLLRYSQRIFGKAEALEALGNALDFLRRSAIIKQVQVGRFRDKRTAYVVERGKMILRGPTLILKCTSCQNAYNGTLPPKSCLYWYCKGTNPLKEIPAQAFYEENNNFHLHFYRDLSYRRMVAEEDSGSIKLPERQRIENRFRAGQVDLLVSTPTLELGVDIGDLVSVGLAKSPPSPASYAQRAGRAGREKKVSLITAFQFQTPLDMYYFRNPKEIMSGSISAPFVSLDNRTIVDRHINSSIIEELFVNSPFAPDLKATIREFIDADQYGLITQHLFSIQESLKQKIARSFPDIKWLTESEITKRINEFPQIVSKSIERFQKEDQVLQRIGDEVDEARKSLRAQTGKEADEERRRLRRIEENIQARLTGYPDGLYIRDVLSHFSRTEVIPRYAFPGTAVELLSGDQEEFGDRSARIAVSELAPGMSVYMKKSKYQVVGFDFEQQPEGRAGRRFWVCKNCQLYATEEQPQVRACPQCHSTVGFERFDDCIGPKVVVVEEDGRPSEEPREFIQPNIDYFVLSPISLPENASKAWIQGAVGLKVMDLGVKEILTLVRSLTTPDGEQKFTICDKCGRLLKNFKEDGSHRVSWRRFCNGHPFTANLYHTFNTNSVAFAIDPSQIPDGVDVQRFLTTLKDALIVASEITVNAAEGEIDGVIKPDTQMIVLFDNVDGGVGYVRQVIERFDEVLSKAASRVLLECDCETGCIKCLWAYRRRRDIPLIDKRLIRDLFKAIEREQSQKRLARVAATKHYIGKKILSITSEPNSLEGAIELRDRLLGAQEEIKLVSLYVTDDPVDWPDGEASWVKILSRCCQNGAAVTVIVREPQKQSHKNALNKLVTAGVKVKIFSIPSHEGGQSGIAHLKQVVIDPGLPAQCAIHMTANLSPETKKNSDTYDFGVGAENSEWITGTCQTILGLETQARNWRTH